MSNSHGLSSLPSDGSSHAILPAPSLLLTLSDELLLTIIQNLDRHTDVPNTRLVCRKFNYLTDTYFYRNVMLTLSEEILRNDWRLKLRVMPPQIAKTKQFSILNQRRVPGAYFHNRVICHPNSYRILRWNLLEELAADANAEFARAACLVGLQFYPHLARFGEHLTVFRWRHAIPLSLSNLTMIIDKQAQTLEELEVTMFQPPLSAATRTFRNAMQSIDLPKLRTFKYHGLSHTEPLPVNRPEKGGRCRMLRPLFQKFYGTIQELVLNQDHCISQVGKTPMTLGRGIHDTLCRLDDLYVDLSRGKDVTSEELPPITLSLKTLELGGFNVTSLFDVPVSSAASPRVRVHLPSIQRLVLNNCYGLEGLLHKLHARKDELSNLREFAVRIEEDNAYFNGLSNVFDALREFLLCFKGLELLSVLVEGDASGLCVGKDVLIHHAKTLKVYSVAARDHLEEDDLANTLRFVSMPTYGKKEKDEISSGCLTSPPALREYGTFLNKIIGGEYVNLRFLSQFQDLRTVVIRNFPPLTTELKEVRNKEYNFWREPRGGVTVGIAVKMAEAFAEQIALPFYALPDSYVRNEESSHDDSLPCPDGFSQGDGGFDVLEEDNRIKQELEKVAAAYHTASRDQLLGFALNLDSSSPTTKKNLTRSVLKQKAQTSPEFREVMKKMDKGTASAYEKEAFEEYQSLVETVLGVKKPKPETKPKLKLLVVGDWSYRDQMNISGPRHWDPTSWSHRSEQHHQASPDEDASDHIYEDYDTWNFKDYRLRAGFKKEFDISLLPIFFAIDWKSVKDKDKATWRWTARAKVLHQDTLEGQGGLCDTKLLDFAWMT